MKKLLIGLMLSLIAFTARADYNDTTSIVTKATTVVKDAAHYTDTSGLFKQVYGDMKEAIGALASSLKVGSEYVYKVLIKQQVVESVTWLTIILALVGIPQIYRRYLLKSMKEVGDNEGYVGMFIFLYILPLLIGTFVFLCTISDIMTGFINPEYGAIRDIISIVKTIKN